MWTKQSLPELIESKLQGYRLILVSNREPYIHSQVGGHIECDRPASGLTIALEPVLAACGGTWIAHRWAGKIISALLKLESSAVAESDAAIPAPATAESTLFYKDAS